MRVMSPLVPLVKTLCAVWTSLFFGNPDTRMSTKNGPFSTTALSKEFAALQNVSVIAWDYFEFSTDLVQFELFGTYYSVKLISLVLPIQKYLYLLPYLEQKNPLKLPLVH